MALNVANFVLANGLTAPLAYVRASSPVITKDRIPPRWRAVREFPLPEGTAPDPGGEGEPPAAPTDEVTFHAADEAAARTLAEQGGATVTELEQIEPEQVLHVLHFGLASSLEPGGPELQPEQLERVPYDLDGENPFKQAYTYLKAERFPGAVDA